MKNLLFLLISIILTTSFTTYAKDKDKKEQTVVFIAHLHCKNCVEKVEKNIPYEKGVKALRVSLENKTIAITFRKDKNDTDKLKAAIEKLGIEVLGIKGQIAKDGDQCKEPHPEKDKQQCTDCCHDGCK